MNDEYRPDNSRAGPVEELECWNNMDEPFEIADNEEDAIRHLDPLIYETEYYNNTKITRNIIGRSGMINPLDQIEKMRNEDISALKVRTLKNCDVFTTVLLAANDHIVASNPVITQYDLLVMDAVYTLYAQGYSDFTPEMVSNVINGTYNATVSPEAIERINRSIQKLSTIQITIDCSQEFKARGPKYENYVGTLTSYLLPIEWIQVIAANGKRVCGYSLIKKPALYVYAENISQLINIPVSVVGSCKKQPDGSTVAILRRCIVMRISSYTNKRSAISRNFINYDNLFSDLGYKKENYSNWRKKRSELHQAVIGIMDQLLEQNIIISYEICRKGKRITGVKFHVPKVPKKNK